TYPALLSVAGTPARTMLPCGHVPTDSAILRDSLPAVGSQASSAGHLQQSLPKVFAQRISQNFLDREGRFLRRRVVPAPGGAPQSNPVGRTIASAAEALRINKGFQKIDRMSVPALPIACQPFRHLPENMRGQMRNPHPREVHHIMPTFLRLSRSTIAGIPFLVSLYAFVAAAGKIVPYANFQIIRRCAFPHGC